MQSREKAAVSEALRGAAARAAAVIRAAGAPGARVPGLDWTVAETAAHVVNEFVDYTAYAQGRKAPAGEGPPSRRNAAANAVQLRTDPDRDLASLADRLGPAVEGFLAVLPPIYAANQADAATGSADTETGAGRPTGGSMPDRAEAGLPAGVLVSNGVRMSWETMTSALLGELLIHGLDVARASRQPWRIERADALRVIAGVMTMVPDYLDRQRASGVRASFELRLRGGPRYLIEIADGRAVTGESGPGARPDCWISADPVAFLEVGFGRSGQWGRIARGKMVAGGRKPWLAAKFGTLITGP